MPIVSVSPDADPIDWRTKGVVTGVKDQLLCDASHAFSVIGAMEGSWAIKKGTLVSMSEQQLIDCVADNEGCDGGSPVRAIEDVIDRGGIANVPSYPYTAVAGTCGVGTAFLVADFSAMSRPEPGDESALASFVSDNGPVSAVLRIRTTAWDNYTTGILDQPVQADSALRFVAVLIAGWGSSGDGDYWIVKTSEGTSFGDQGYVLIRRGTNAFGIADFVVWPEAN